MEVSPGIHADTPARPLGFCRPVNKTSARQPVSALIQDCIPNINFCRAEAWRVPVLGVGSNLPKASPTNTPANPPECQVCLGTGGPCRVPSTAPEKSVQVAGCHQSSCPQPHGQNLTFAAQGPSPSDTQDRASAEGAPGSGAAGPWTLSPAWPSPVLPEESSLRVPLRKVSERTPDGWARGESRIPGEAARGHAPCRS